MTGVHRGHYPLPLCVRDVGGILEVQAGPLGLAIGNNFDTDRRIHSRDLHGAVQLPHAFGQGHGYRPRRRGDAQCVRADHGHSGQAERAGESRGHSVSDRPGPLPVQGRAVEGLTCLGAATDPDPEIELRTGDRQRRRAGGAAEIQCKAAQGYSDALCQWRQYRIQGGGYAGSIRDGVRSAQRGESHPAKRQAVDGFRNRRRQYDRRANPGAAR